MDKPHEEEAKAKTSQVVKVGKWTATIVAGMFVKHAIEQTGVVPYVYDMVVSGALQAEQCAEQCCNDLAEDWPEMPDAPHGSDPRLPPPYAYTMTSTTTTTTPPPRSSTTSTTTTTAESEPSYGDMYGFNCVDDNDSPSDLGNLA